jgi:hypothetical protein
MEATDTRAVDIPASCEREEIVFLLLEKGSDIWSESRAWKPPTQCAAEQGDEDTVTIFRRPNT